MSDKPGNRIQMPGQPPEETVQACKIGMTNFPGTVEMTFNPPITRMRMRPPEARSLAIALLGHAEAAENPPIILVPPGS